MRGLAADCSFNLRPLRSGEAPWKRRPKMLRTFFALTPAIALAACSMEAAETPARQSSDPPQVLAESPVAAGKYLVDLGGCQDCHTVGWAENGGATPEDAQLLGIPVGFKGPWGTSYANNLRLVAAAYTPEEWVEMMHTRRGLPPMPWAMVNRMSDADLLAIHAYLTSLGEKGEAMPAAVPPGTEPDTPYIYFAPVPPLEASSSDPIKG